MGRGRFVDSNTLVVFERAACSKAEWAAQSLMRNEESDEVLTVDENYSFKNQDLPNAKAHVHFVIIIKYPSPFELSTFIC